MADVKKCDVCGKLGNYEEILHVHLGVWAATPTYGTERDVDLCPACLQKVYDACPALKPKEAGMRRGPQAGRYETRASTLLIDNAPKDVDKK